ncbi:MAG: hypothetical protein LC725_12120, partial [Lentisphaerae bacterium]|nr:hypothetical protein [Lentisphaerota bacterium]
MGDLTVTRSYESNRDLLTQVKNAFDTVTVSQYDYVNDSAGRRIAVKQSGTAFKPAGDMFNLYQYNTRSEVTGAERYFGTNTNSLDNPVGLQDWSYAYDNIGNRSASSRANAISDYSANLLNQYTQRTVPGYADILGTAETNVTVTVNTQAVTRQSYYPPSHGTSYGATRWHKRLDVDNVLTSAYEEIVTTGVYSPGGTNDDIVTSVTGHMFVAETPEGFTYDEDGNLLTDGRWAYSWDSENRLIAMQTLPGLCPSVPLILCNFDYDYMSRRVAKTVYEWDDGTTNWVEQSSSAFLYDGWNLISEQTHEQTNAQTNSFVFGLDLSGSLQGAGGVGGLLASVGMAGSPSTPAFYTYDGNGNVSEILDIGAGTPSSRIAAHYEYSPFGETIVATGDLAKDNPFRFSTKYTDNETTLVYYGYRYYSPGMGR